MTPNTAIAPSQAEAILKTMILRSEIDWLIAGNISEEITANLYSARLHVMRCLRELTGEAL